VNLKNRITDQRQESAWDDKSVTSNDLLLIVILLSNIFFQPCQYQLSYSSYHPKRFPDADR
jgi:hypothetical protein